MLFTVLASVLIGLGAAALGYLIVRVACITVGWLKNKIKERMKENGSDTTVVASAKKVKKAVKKAIEENMDADVDEVSLDELEEELEGDGVVMADMNDGEIDSDSIAIFMTDDMDKKTKKMLKEHEGMVKITA